MKQELQATSSKIRYQEKKFERNRTNSYKPKNVYPDFKNDKTEIKTIPPKEDIENTGKIFGRKQHHSMITLHG